ncbi:MAG: hypothetical protein HQK84_07310 [Nitrospinae bacterium]|nr:hypothetical protein [Nitrospinota bacterium]
MSLVIKHPVKANIDARGFCWFPFQQLAELDEKQMVNFHFAELKPGAVRGNHSHTSHTEFTMVSGSSINLTFEDQSGNKEEEFYEKSPDILFEIPPDIKHSIENKGTETNYLIGFFKGKGKVKTERF